MKFFRLSLYSAILISVFSFTYSEYLQPRWAVVGSASLSFKQDKASIPIKLKDTPFTTIRLGFKGRTINMHHSTIHFENGETQTVPMRKKFRSGSMTRIIDLAGGKRKISRIIVYYNPDHLAKENVTVELWAKVELDEKLAGSQ